MATPNSVISEIATMTLRNRTGKLADNVSDNNGLLRALTKKGPKLVRGGRTISQEIEFAENGTVLRYSGYDTLNISPSEVFTTADFNLAQAAVAVSISGLEQLQNSGKEAVIDLLEARIKNAEKSLMNTIASDCYSDGTADGGKQIGGLQLLVADTPTNTVGGISGSTYTFWRNISADSTTDYSAAATAANIQSQMNRTFMQVVRGNDKPKLITADNNYYRLYWESLQAIQRISSPKAADAGYGELEYMGVPVILDGGLGGGCPTNHMYFLNTDYIYFRPHADRNFVVLDGERFGLNQDAMVKIIAWAGQMTISNRSLQAVLKD